MSVDHEAVARALLKLSEAAIAAAREIQVMSPTVASAKAHALNGAIASELERIQLSREPVNPEQVVVVNSVTITDARCRELLKAHCADLIVYDEMPKDNPVLSPALKSLQTPQGKGDRKKRGRAWRAQWK